MCISQLRPRRLVKSKYKEIMATQRCNSHQYSGYLIYVQVSRGIKAKIELKTGPDCPELDWNQSSKPWSNDVCAQTALIKVYASIQVISVCSIHQHILGCYQQTWRTSELLGLKLYFREKGSRLWQCVVALRVRTCNDFLAGLQDSRA